MKVKFLGLSHWFHGCGLWRRRKKIPINVFVEAADCAFHFVPLIDLFAKFQTKMAVFISFEKCRISDSFANYFLA